MPPRRRAHVPGYLQHLHGARSSRALHQAFHTPGAASPRIPPGLQIPEIRMPSYPGGQVGSPQTRPRWDPGVSGRRSGAPPLFPEQAASTEARARCRCHKPLRNAPSWAAGLGGQRLPLPLPPSPPPAGGSARNAGVGSEPGGRTRGGRARGARAAVAAAGGGRSRAVPGPGRPGGEAAPRARRAGRRRSRSAPGGVPAARPRREAMPTQRDSGTMSHTVAGGGGGDHSHQVRVKAYYRG